MNKSSNNTTEKIPFHKKTSDMNNCSTTHQNTQVSKSASSVLTLEHFDYLVDERNLSVSWVKANFESLTQKEAIEQGYPSPSDGILLKSSLPSLQNQVRPNEPKAITKPNGKQKALKYLTPAGCEVDAMLPNHPEYPNFWTNTEELKERCYKINGLPCLLITEGFIDALIPTSEGIPTIALTGVENGLTGSKHDKEGRRYLVPTLRHFAELGFGFIIGFDADSKSNKNVITAQISLVRAC